MTDSNKVLKVNTGRNDIRFLRELYQNGDQNEKSIFKALVAYKQKEKETSIADIEEAPVGSVYRHVLVSILKKIDEGGIGKFTTGRRGKSSRFKSEYSLKSFGEVAIGEASSLENFVPLSLAEIDQIESLNLKEYSFPLTHDQNLTIRLPKDLTQEQAERLSQFIKSMALPSKE